MITFLINYCLICCMIHAIFQMGIAKVIEAILTPFGVTEIKVPIKDFSYLLIQIKIIILCSIAIVNIWMLFKGLYMIITRRAF